MIMIVRIQIRILATAFILLFTSCSNVDKEYYADGSLKAIGEFKSGLLHGSYKHYYKNGNLKESSEWKNGRRMGISHFYHKNGNLKSISYYVDGLENGVSKSFYPSGQQKNEFTWQDGNRDGEFIEYFKSGQVYKQGEIYLDDGEIFRSYYLREYYPNGKPKKYVYRNDSVTYLKKYSKNDGELLGSILPVRVERRTVKEICFKLLHTNLPKDSLAVGFQVWEKVNKEVKKSIGPYFQRNGKNVCIKIHEKSRVSGEFYEIFSPNNSVEGIKSFSLNVDSLPIIGA